MAEKPVVQDSASSFAWGWSTTIVGVLVMVLGANAQGGLFRVVGLLIVIRGAAWIVQGAVRSARNRDAMARAVLEERKERSGEG